MPTPAGPSKFQPPKKGGNNFLYVIVLAGLLVLSYYTFNSDKIQAEKPTEIPINQMLEAGREGEYKSIDIKGSEIIATTEKETSFVAYMNTKDSPDDLGVYEWEGVEVSNANSERTAFWANLLSSWLPIILFFALIVFMAKQLGKGAGNAFSFGKSQARVYDKNMKKKTTFDDVAGMDEAKEDLVEIVDFLKHPKKYTKMGAKIPRGVVLVGNPGTGKTLLARAVAGEADVPFFSISGSEFVEMFVGVGASRVRDLFQKAKNNAPCIIFIDEIDAVGRQRGFGMGGGHDEREQTLNQILTEMDGFENETNVIVMAATNRPDVLDAALMRPGRFDRRVIIDMPNIKERREILNVHIKNKKMAKDADLEVAARQTPGFSGADLENLLNEAAILAAKRDKDEIGSSELSEAVEKIGLGSEKKSRKMSEEEKRITALHELGHALPRKLLPKCTPVHKVSIIPRGMALGVTWSLPEDDVHLHSYTKIKSEICSALGGYAAEEVFFGEVTTGPGSDLEKATQMARNMVTKYGMSADLGPMIFGESSNSFMGREMAGAANYSQDMAYRIDQAVGKILKEAKELATKLILENKALMERMAKDLLVKEEFNKDEFDAYFGPKKKDGKQKEVEGKDNKKKVHKK